MRKKRIIIGRLNHTSLLQMFKSLRPYQRTHGQVNKRVHYRKVSYQVQKSRSRTSDEKCESWDTRGVSIRWYSTVFHLHPPPPLEPSIGCFFAVDSIKRQVRMKTKEIFAKGVSQVKGLENKKWYLTRVLQNSFIFSNLLFRRLR